MSEKISYVGDTGGDAYLDVLSTLERTMGKNTTLSESMSPATNRLRLTQLPMTTIKPVLHGNGKPIKA